MRLIQLKKYFLIIYLAALVTCRFASGQPITLPNPYANQPSCTYFVSNLGSDSGTGISRNTGAFLTIQHAHDVVKSFIQTNGHTKPIGICIQSGDYYSYDWDQAKLNVTSVVNNSAGSVLAISVSGTEMYPIWIMGDPQNTVYPTLHQSGYNGIAFDPGVQYITIQHLNIMGQAQNPNAPTSTLMTRIPAGVSGTSPAWPFYDGNCVGASGTYPQGSPNLSNYSESPHNPE